MLKLSLKIELALIALLSKSVPQVRGKQNDIGCKRVGNLSIGINNPHKNNIGNLKKLENVCASNTSFADTAINNPNKAEVIAIKTTAITVIAQLIPFKFMKKAAKTRGTKALNIPNNIAPSILANTKVLMLIGANNNLSNE